MIMMFLCRSSFSSFDSSRDFRVIVLIFVIFCQMATGFQTGPCLGSPKCHCKWSEGKRMADCSNKGFTNIPDSLTHDIQTLILDGNNLNTLSKDSFKAAGLLNIQTLSLRHCDLTFIDPKAFRDLKIMTRLDLSLNNITHLNKETFDGNNGLKALSLSNNPIKSLGAYQFTPLRSLKSIDLSHCSISRIDKTSFQNLGNSVETVLLDSNRMRTLPVESFVPLTNLKSLTLHNNLWVCDCELKDFRDWVIDKRLYDPATLCSEPSRLNSKKWTRVEAAEFACKPKIEIPYKYVFGTLGANAELACKIKGSPIPRARWVVNGRIVNNNTNPEPFASQSWVIKDSNISPDGSSRWYNLSISNPTIDDLGRYLCVAENNGGVMEEKVTLTFDSPETFTTGIKMSDEQLTIVIAISLAIVVLFLFVAFCCCFFFVSNSDKKGRDQENASALGQRNYEPSTENQRLLLASDETRQRPSFILSTNREAVDMSHMSDRQCGTLVNDHKQHIVGSQQNRIDIPDLVNHDNVLRGSCFFENSTSSSLNSECFGPVSPFGKHSLSYLNPSQLLETDNCAPIMMNQPHAMQMESFSRSGTLPLSHNLKTNRQNRSISYDHGGRILSFSGKKPERHGQLNDAPRIRELSHDQDYRIYQRQGYITLPRRPRSSWCIPTEPNIALDPISKREPIYDGIGPRTSIDGSSTVSLGKRISQPECLPSLLTPRATNQSSICSPIKELNEPPSYTVPSRITLSSQNLTGSGSEAALEENISAYCEPFGKALAPEKIEQSILKSDELDIQETENEKKARKVTKIKPVPPPKPKPFDFSESSSKLLPPLVTFQDEGVEGSEV